MRVFCPNCGSDNEGPPGGKVTCRSCAASFDVPGEAAPPAAPQVTTAPPRGAPSPGWNPPPQQPLNQARPWVPPPGSYGNAPTTTNTLAIVSLVTGLTSCGCGCLTGVVAVVTGILAHNQINASGGTQTGKGLATAGIIIGVLGTVFATIVGVLMAIGGATQ